MTDLITQFQSVSKDFFETTTSFPATKREEKLFDQWSLKDVLAHIFGWHSLFLNNLENLTNNKTPIDWGKINDFNQKNVADNQLVSFQSISKNLKDTDQKLIKKLESLNSSFWVKKFWPNKTYTPKKILEIEIRHYSKTHTPQIKTIII